MYSDALPAVCVELITTKHKIRQPTQKHMRSVSGIFNINVLMLVLNICPNSAIKIGVRLSDQHKVSLVMSMHIEKNVPIHPAFLRPIPGIKQNLRFINHKQQLYFICKMLFRKALYVVHIQKPSKIMIDVIRVVLVTV